MFVPCWHEQIATTYIHGVPKGIDQYRLEHEEGDWSFGVNKVEFSNGYITITTYLVPDHGGPDNHCIGQGYASFKLSFYKKGHLKKN